jgi:hypothetical protein
VPLIDLTIQYRRTQEEARQRLEAAVHEVSAKLGTMLRRVDWAADRNRVRLEGVGFWAERTSSTGARPACGAPPTGCRACECRGGVPAD